MHLSVRNTANLFRNTSLLSGSGLLSNYQGVNIEMEEAFGDNLSSLLDKELWKEKVQDKITDSDFLKQF